MDKKKIEKIIGDRIYIEERYRHIYGSGLYKEKADKIIAKNQNKVKLYFLIIILLLIILIISLFAENDGLYKDSRGIVRYVKNDKKGETVSLIVEGERNGIKFSRPVTITFINEDEKLSVTDSSISNRDVLGENIDVVTREIGSSEKKKINLPNKLPNGTPVIWKENKENNLPLLIIVACLLGYLLYKSRYAQIDKEEEEARRSVEKELPGFISKLNLLLNTGMVFKSSMSKVVKDSSKMESRRNSYFYSQLLNIMDGVEERKSSLHKELEEFAKRTKVREFIRVTGIISDNIYKGIELTDKLQKEGDQLWFSHKKNIEEKGRLAESKLVAPLGLILAILVIITVAPAMIEM